MITEPGITASIFKNLGDCSCNSLKFPMMMARCDERENHESFYLKFNRGHDQKVE